MLNLERILQLDDLLRSRERQTAETLAVELECNEKTVRTYINYMRDRFDAPIEFSRQHGWHYSHKDWRMSSVALTRGEVFALIGLAGAFVQKPTVMKMISAKTSVFTTFQLFDLS